MREQHGFTLIELLMFIIISSILVSAIFTAYVGALASSPSLLQDTIAHQIARGCAEWYLGKRRMNGYSSVSGANCTNPLSLPTLCSTVSGYTLVARCEATTISGDSNYETLTFTVTGNGSAELTLLLGNY